MLGAEHCARLKLAATLLSRTAGSQDESPYRAIHKFKRKSTRKIALLRRAGQCCVARAVGHGARIAIPESPRTNHCSPIATHEYPPTPSHRGALVRCFRSDAAADCRRDHACFGHQLSELIGVEGLCAVGEGALGVLMDFD